jgi:peptide-methionine (S)-S-oxide reductase
MRSSAAILAVLTGTMGLALWGAGGYARRKEASQMKRASQAGSGEPAKIEKATFAAGCFWGVEAAFRRVEGVVATRVGYTGGHFDNPTYEEVCAGRTGHAEAVEVTYDTSLVSYEDLLKVFWGCHDPTTLNRQGPDVGYQYRSAIFCYSPDQKAAAEASKAQLDGEGRHKRPIVTQVVPASAFYQAEEYHQQYLQKRGRASCSTTIR